MPPRKPRDPGASSSTTSMTASATAIASTSLSSSTGLFFNADSMDIDLTPVPKNIKGESLPLISFENDKFVIGQQALHLLKDMEPPISVVSVAGLYRTGKSFLLNRVILQRTGFSVGSTVNACTKGIWMWSEPIISIDSAGRSVKVIIIDTEGIGAPTADASHDTRVFSLALLLSSFFVYNSVGNIDEQALSNLSLVTNISKEIRASTHKHTLNTPLPTQPSAAQAARAALTPTEDNEQTDDEESGEDESDDDKIDDHPATKASPAAIKLQNGGDQNSADFHEFLPAFLWVLRDFALQLQDRDGHEIEAEQYLENALEESTGRNAGGKNRIRECLKQFFPERGCVTLVRPCLDEKNLQKLDSLPDSSLRPEFMRQARKLRERIMNEATRRPLTMQGKELSGSMLGFLCQAYSNAINRGEAPVIHDAWTYMCEAQRTRTEQQIVTTFTQEATALITSSPHGINPPVFRDMLAVSKAEALVKYTNTCKGLASHESQIESRLAEGLDDLYRRNHDHYITLLHQRALTDHDTLVATLDPVEINASVEISGDRDVPDFQSFRRQFTECHLEFDRLFVDSACDLAAELKNPYVDAPSFETEAASIWYKRNTPVIWKAVNRYYAASGHEHSRLQLENDTLRKQYDDAVANHSASLEKIKGAHERALHAAHATSSEKLSESADRIATIISKLNDSEMRVTTLEAEVMQCSRDSHTRVAELEQLSVSYESRAESAEGQVNILREEMGELLEIQGVLEAKEMELRTATIEKDHLEKQLAKMRSELEARKLEFEKADQRYKKEGRDIQERALQSVERMKQARKVDQKKLQLALDQERGSHEQTQARVFVLDSELVQLKRQHLENVSLYEEQVRRLRMQTEESDARLLQTTEDHNAAVRQFEQKAKAEREAIEAREMAIRDRAIQTEKERCKTLKEMETRAIGAETRLSNQRRQLNEAEESLKRKRVKTEDQPASLELATTKAELNWLRRQTSDQETQLNKSAARIQELEALNKELERSFDGKIASVRLDYEIRLAASEEQQNENGGARQ